MDVIEGWLQINILQMWALQGEMMKDTHNHTAEKNAQVINAQTAYNRL